MKQFGRAASVWPPYADDSQLEFVGLTRVLTTGFEMDKPRGEP
ncbi:MAG: hypothetical protein QOF48_3778 [Verrucomicrobiota bacterium]|jgi:hypothetical protein